MRVTLVLAAAAAGAAWLALGGTTVTRHTHIYVGSNAGAVWDLGGGHCAGMEVRGDPGPFGWLPPGWGTDREVCR